MLDSLIIDPIIKDTILKSTFIRDTLNVSLVNLGASSYWSLVKDILYPAMLLFAGAFTAYCFDNYREKKKFYLTREYFFHSLYSLYTAINNQIDIYKKNIEEVGKEVDYPTLILKHNDLQLNNVKIISQKDIYKIFVGRKNKDDNLSGIETCILISSCFAGLEIEIEKANSYPSLLHEITNSIMRNYSEQYVTFIQKFNELMNEYAVPKTPLFQEMISKISALDDNYRKNLKGTEYASVFFHMKYFINPLNEIVVEYEYVPLSTIIYGFQYNFESLSAKRKAFVTDCFRCIQNLYEIRNNLGEIIDNYKKYLPENLRNKFEEESKIIQPQNQNILG
jgi:hypothetical protein